MPMLNDCDCPACQAARAIGEYCERRHAENRPATDEEIDQMHAWTEVILNQ